MIFSYRCIISLKRSIKLRKMSTFVSRANPVTGKLDWIVQDDDYDFHQEVARSAYADMLHDTERNQMYYQAIKKAISIFHERGQRANVLDIGTGTGLLSMMAARSGADTITACEAFRPMSDCAVQVIKDNGLAARIKVIPKRSTELTVGAGLCDCDECEGYSYLSSDGDLPERANILVTEVFDTELIGEGALGTFQHAHNNLLEKDCIVVPSNATVFVQVVSSPFFRRCNVFETIHLPNRTAVVPPDNVKACPGAAAVHDLQLDQVTQDMFTAITEPVQVFWFDFSGRDQPQFKRQSNTVVKSLRSSFGLSGSNRETSPDHQENGGGGKLQCDALFMWWQLEMDTSAEIILSTAPRWAHPTPNNMQWRDHWMQAVYYPINRLSVEGGEEFVVHSYHDEYSMWFDLSHGNEGPAESRLSPACSCSAHIVCCRTRTGMLNDPRRNRAYVAALSSVINESTVCLSLGDSSLLPLIAAKLGAKKVYAVENNVLSRRFIGSYVDANGLQSSIVVLGKPVSELNADDLDNKQVTLLIGEPFFSTSILPWHNLHFLYARSELGSLLAPDCTVLPAAVTFKAIAVEFEHLWKIRSAVGLCEGFNLATFDKLIEGSSNIADAYMEAHPLWEYPSKPLTPVFDLLHINMSKSVHGVKTVEREGTIELCAQGCCNGVAVWMDYRLDADHVVSTGLLAAPIDGHSLQWDPHTRQGVHLFPIPVDVNPAGANRWSLRHHVTFRPRSGDIDFEFSLVPMSSDVLIM